jgi:hypothetical protein
VPLPVYEVYFFFFGFSPITHFSTRGWLILGGILHIRDVNELDFRAREGNTDNTGGVVFANSL